MRTMLNCTAPRSRLIYTCVAKHMTTASVPMKAPVKPAVSDAEPRVKRAPSAYNLFVKATFPSIKKENPGLAFADTSKKVMDKWMSLTADVREPYEKEAAKLKAVVAAKRAELRTAEKATARPPGTYILFVKERRQSVVAANPGKSAMEVGSILGSQWKQLAPEERQKYSNEAKALYAKWKSAQGITA